MSVPFLVLAVLFLAYSNGANDNFKGVASLFGNNTTTYCATKSAPTSAPFPADDDFRV